MKPKVVPIVRYSPEPDRDTGLIFEAEQFRGVNFPSVSVWWKNPDVGQLQTIGMGVISHRAEGLDAALYISLPESMQGRSLIAKPGFRCSIDGPPQISAIYLQHQTESERPSPEG